MKIISKRERVTVTNYCLEFDYEGALRNHGFSFDCDKNGFIDTNSYEGIGLENLIGCLMGTNSTVYMGINEYTHSYTEPAVGLCDLCNRKVYLDGFTNTCDCGADYNMNGSLLASREFWGEETGEHISDILGV